MKSRTYRSLRERLASHGRRAFDRPKDAILPTPPVPISLNHPHEIAAMAVGLLVLRQVEETGGTRLYERAIHDALKRLTAHAGPAEMMRLEVEAYEIIDWMTEGDAPYDDHHLIRTADDGVLEYDPTATIEDLVRAACHRGLDLKINYFSSKRGEMNTRVISPKAIAAETYVRAHCHARGEERVFRMERIRKARPVNARPMRNPYYEHALSDETRQLRAQEQSAEFYNLSFDFSAAPTLSAAPSEPTPVPETPSKPASAPKARVAASASAVPEPANAANTMASEESVNAAPPNAPAASETTNDTGVCDATPQPEDERQLSLLDL